MYSALEEVFLQREEEVEGVDEYEMEQPYLYQQEPQFSM